MSSSPWYVRTGDTKAWLYVEMLGDDAFTLGLSLETAHRFESKLEAMRIARRVVLRGQEVAVIPFDDVERVGPGPDRPAVHERVVPEWAVEPLAVAHVLCEWEGKRWDDLSTSEVDRYCRAGFLVLERLPRRAA